MSLKELKNKVNTMASELKDLNELTESKIQEVDHCKKSSEEKANTTTVQYHTLARSSILFPSFFCSISHITTHVCGQIQPHNHSWIQRQGHHFNTW